MARYDFKHVSVLLVDDNVHMRHLVKEMLWGFGFLHIVEAADGTEGLLRLREGPIDLCVCDWMMDPLDGHDFIRLVRTSPDTPNRKVPIIMMTGHTEQARVRMARDAGVTEFMAKPLSAGTLLSRIIEIIDRPRSFVQSRRFTGPDRRRRPDLGYEGEKRRLGEAPPEGGSLLTPEEVNLLLHGEDI